MFTRGAVTDAGHAFCEVFAGREHVLNLVLFPWFCELSLGLDCCKHLILARSLLEVAV